MSNWQYRLLEQISELEKVVDLEITVWQLDPKDSVPASIMHAMVTSGGLVIGAY